MATQGKSSINNDSDDENDTLAELNEFLDGDHTGQRLADFLIRKRGLPRIKDSVFGGCPLPKFKFTTNLKRSITPPLELETVVSMVTVQSKLPLKELSPINKTNVGNITHNKDTAITLTSPTQVSQTGGLPHFCDLPKPTIVDSPKHDSIPAPAINDVARRPGTISPVYNSPRRRSGCFSDKLRRSAIKRRSLFAHRRQLLSEFADSPDDFEPQVCSTPAVITQPSMPTCDAPQISADPSSSADSESLMRNLNRCDEQLRNMIEEALDRTVRQAKEQSNLGSPHTPSPPSSRPSSPGSQRRRTYTVQKGSMPGQVVLTPTKLLPECDVSVKAQSDKLRSPVVRLRNLSNVGVQTCVKSTMPVSSSVLRSTAPMRTSSQKPFARSIIIDSPLQTNDAVSQPETEEIIPETQDVPQNQHEHLTHLFKKNESPMVVIPVYQTFNGPPTTPIHSTFTIAHEKSIQTKHNVNATSTNVLENQAELANEPSANAYDNETEKNRNNSYKEPLANKSIQTSAVAGANTVDNVEGDIITDDESMEDPKESSMDKVFKNDSAAPLNLATDFSGATRTRRLRRRLPIPQRKQVDKPDRSEVDNKCDANEVLNLRRRGQIGGFSGLNRIKKMTLNKAPNTPINGEKFAFELARMTNYEILDLRKRNSLGKIFPLCGRKSVVDKELLKEERLNLEKHIDLEIKRRNLSNQNSIERQDEIEINGTQSEDEKTGMLPAPVGFEDACQSQECRHDLSIETLGMKYKRGRPSRRSSRRTHNLPMSETLKNYLEATKNLQDRKKSFKTTCKRSLYTKGNSDSEETLLSSPEKIRKMCSDIEIVPSPPVPFKTTDVRLSQLHIVPPPPTDVLLPPPPLDVLLPPPPCQFSTDSDSHSEKELHAPRKLRYTQSLPKKVKSKSEMTEKQVNDSIESFANDPAIYILNNVAEEVNSTNYAIMPSPMRKSTSKCRQSVRVQCVVEEQTKSLSEEQTTAVCSSNTEIMETLRMCTPSPSPISTEEHNKSSAETNSPNVSAATGVYKALPELESVVAHSTTETPTPTVSDDDQPSTSQAALNRSAATVIRDDALFKKPTVPAPKRGRKKNRESVQRVVEQQENDISLRRSKRGHVPLKNTWSFQNKDPTPLFQVLYQRQMDLCLARSQKRYETLKNKTRLSSVSSELSAQYDCVQPVCTSTPLNPSEPQQPGKRKRSYKNMTLSKAIDPRCSGLGDTNTCTSDIEPKGTTRESDTETEDISGRVRLQQQPLSVINEGEVYELRAPSKRSKKGKREERKVKTKKKKNDQRGESKSTQSAPVEELNSIFDQLKAASFCGEQMQTPAQDVSHSEEAKNIENSSVANNKTISKEVEVQTVKSGQSDCSRNELIAWLKGLTGNAEGDVENDMFFGMHISTRGNLVFMDLDGIDYAFYDTEEKGSLGYMRFKPKQIRPPKRAKAYNLHFVVLTGEFMIGTRTEDTRNERGNFGPGDMIAINKGSRYTIENLLNDISILMVFKK